MRSCSHSVRTLKLNVMACHKNWAEWNIMWHLETFVIVLRHRLPHYFRTVISETPRGLSSTTARWQHWAGQFLASLSSTSHIPRGQNLLHKGTEKQKQKRPPSHIRTNTSTQIHSHTHQITHNSTKLPFFINIVAQKHFYLSFSLCTSPHQKPSVSICTGPAVRISATEPQHGTALWWCNSLAHT